jgi:hypothetical protein
MIKIIILVLVIVMFNNLVTHLTIYQYMWVVVGVAFDFVLTGMIGGTNDKKNHTDI